MRGFHDVLPLPRDVKAQGIECKAVLGVWSRRSMNRDSFDRVLASDALDFALGAIDLSSSRVVHDFIPLSMHINAKELRASSYAVRSLVKPRERGTILVDNTPAYFYLLKIL